MDVAIKKYINKKKIKKKHEYKKFSWVFFLYQTRRAKDHFECEPANSILYFENSWSTKIMQIVKDLYKKSEDQSGYIYFRINDIHL